MRALLSAVAVLAAVSAPALAQGRADFEQRFSKVLAGSISGLELESLNRQLVRECATIETEWLQRGEAK